MLLTYRPRHRTSQVDTPVSPLCDLSTLQLAPVISPRESIDHERCALKAKAETEALFVEARRLAELQRAQSEKRKLVPSSGASPSLPDMDSVVASPEEEKADSPAALKRQAMPSAPVRRPRFPPTLSLP